MILAPFLEEILQNATANFLTEAFIWIMIAVFLVSVLFKRSGEASSFVLYTPTLLTSIGILGTFAGIIVGLLGFDPNNIDGSISMLLGGLKTAFITSLVGMTLSIIFKSLLSSKWGNKKIGDTETPDNISTKDFFLVMQQQAEAIISLKKIIGDNDESSLMSQLKILRADAGENHKKMHEQIILSNEKLGGISKNIISNSESFHLFEDKLWIKFQDFADMLSKSATEQVIEALKQVIQDFNNNLIEQFGQNFKELNSAVRELVNWQENYKHQLAEMMLQYNQGVEAITLTKASVVTISEETKSIPASMKELKEVIEVNQHQISELDRHLVAFKDVRDKAVEAVPEIKAQVQMAIQGAQTASTELARGITESADQYRDAVDQTRAALINSASATATSTEEIKEHLNAAISDIDTHMRNLLAELLEGGKSLNNNFKLASSELIEGSDNISKAFNKDLEKMRENLSKSIESSAQEHIKSSEKVFAGLEKTIENALSNTGESINKQVEMIDKTLGEEITKVIQHMANALASISGQFTNDYSQLVTKMNDVVRKQIQ
ncbi:hypothetical protein [Cellvibrio polysaccharolyticus]|uniref:MotA/TolQ/ExbB proton channel domain-containing protein n=1 Tax=Cellvibrio polysaccharolyticus TaxID=2082724 RepID=A0A928YTN7_9GAMM|nr:hypothetical protein [Cellvibrio polysaccharolyticus]MBE8717209.1 hypothetical protein [Cellvibrio polysaccharolyticus]